ncbi:geranylgeranyl reductase family protein [Nocardioides anomalus]|uniref:Geranylgeranyl reductase family protein n=1 Tax=Nocardioides anomalus TaxID=2712223 RepID=A0A6G6WKF3_9ACTN|nr:geranylgeranyl reductase family protein [Nocardioides anomalus]QIG45637.1 geranylgeranyl reductase family protein [Nocardioides anomalus]
MEEYDVAVLGAGPAGSSAARAAAQAGARVVVLDRAAFPRYKTCGGGLIGPSLRALPGAPPVRAAITRVSLSLDGRRRRTRVVDEPCLQMVTRPELDVWLLDRAAAAGAEVRVPCRFVSLDDDVVTTDAGSFRAGVVVAADGTSSRLAREVGVRLGHVDLGLELELEAGPQAERWADRVHLDWGPLPGSYAWVFPKGDTLTVGVIAARGLGDATRRYLRDVVTRLGLDGLRVVHDSGHLTRCRTPDSPLGRGRVLLAGDAAGLLEPWTREGISFATRSGALAGAAAAGGPDGAVERYRAGLAVELLPEMAAGERCLRAFERRPWAFHELIRSTSVGWHQFARITRGDTTLARAVERRPVRAGLGLLSLPDRPLLS